MKHVYVLDMDNELVKIGVSDDVNRRISEVQNSSGFSVRRNHKTKLMPNAAALALERDLHDYFSAYRTHGEFFKLTFKDACNELDKRELTTPINFEDRTRTPQEEVSDALCLFIKSFCTADINERGYNFKGLDMVYFLEEFVAWFNANSNTFACKIKTFSSIDYDRRDYSACISHCKFLSFYDATTGEEFFLVDKIYDFFRKSLAVPRSLKSFGLFWKKDSPQERVYQRKAQCIRDAFTDLDQQAQDAIIGGFIADAGDIDKRKLLTYTTPLNKFLSRQKGYIERRLKKLCGEYFDVEIEGDQIIARLCTQELDAERFKEYRGSSTQILQRYCRRLRIYDGKHYSEHTKLVEYVGD